MRKSHLAALAAMLALGSASPALAAWDRIGSVEFERSRDHERQYANFAGRIEGINLRAVNEDVRCNRVTATFGNGKSRRVYSGVLRTNHPVNVDLPGQDRNVKRLDFVCRSLGRHDARVDIAVNIGQYRAEWKNGPYWAQAWARLFGWNGNRKDSDRWVRLGSERFEGRRDHETTYAGWHGKSVQAVALKPVDGDARCNRVKATFANGHTRNLNIQGGERLREDKFYTLDLPGNERNLKSLNLTCSAIRDRSVTVEVYAQS
ncbi:MAG: hypothetical protein GC166_11180 [Alphaproteobacteria bacterium]|nr:hypothetical protein [Alphaproteobacteria bacterium]